MNDDQRHSVFKYVYEKADNSKYMAMDSPASTTFQNELESDNKLELIAGERLTRKYIKDTILNKYSKDRRYIDASDVLSVISDLIPSDVIGTKVDFQNGIFYIHHNNKKINCTSASFDQWETSIKRLGKWDKKEIRFVFLTCGGVEQSTENIKTVKDILFSLGVIEFIVKPCENSIAFEDIFLRKIIGLKKIIDPKLLTTCFADFSLAFLKMDKGLLCNFSTGLLTKRFCILTGLAGSGKTKLAEAFAMWLCESDQQYRIVAVGADWTSNENLLGYADALRAGQYPYHYTQVRWGMLPIPQILNKDTNELG